VRLADRSSNSIAILLCTMQGQRFLREQLDSIVRQTHRNWTIWVSDDGSNDDTHTILSEYRTNLGDSRLFVHSGPSDGFAANFLSLACKAGVSADFYAFADQDDVWEVDKLALALNWLQTVPSHLPALYCGRTRIVDAKNQDIGFSPLFTKPPCFANALVENIAGGNTMMFNNAARRFLCKAGPEVKVVSHDWWTYLIVAGCGGRVFYDLTPMVRYRQHDTNLIGFKSSWSASMTRLRMLFYGRFQHWNDINLEALKTMRQHLTPENKFALDEFLKARNSPFIARQIRLRRSGIHRQTVLGNIGLFVASIFKKL